MQLLTTPVLAEAVSLSGGSFGLLLILAVAFVLFRR
jgi:hypothetical protein